MVGSLFSISFDSPSTWHIVKTLDYSSRDMLNFHFLEKSLGIVSPPHFMYDFSIKCFSCYNQPFFLKMTKKLRQKIKFPGEIKEHFSTVGTPRPFSAGGWGVGWTSNQIFRRRGGAVGLGRTSTFRRGLLERGEWIFSGGRRLIPQCTLCFHHFQRVFSCQK